MIISCMSFSLQCVLGLISVFLCIQQKTGSSLILWIHYSVSISVRCCSFFSFPSRIGAPKWLDVICEIFCFCLLCLIAINKHLVLPETAGHRRCPRQQNKVICKLQGLVLIALSTSECWQRLTKLFDFSCSCSPVNRAPVNKLKVQMLLLDVHACVALCIVSLALEKWSICFCVFSENFFLHILAFT